VLAYHNRYHTLSGVADRTAGAGALTFQFSLPQSASVSFVATISTGYGGSIHGEASPVSGSPPLRLFIGTDNLVTPSDNVPTLLFTGDSPSNMILPDAFFAGFKVQVLNFDKLLMWRFRTVSSRPVLSLAAIPHHCLGCVTVTVSSRFCDCRCPFRRHLSREL
jgi:hypothetical protein